MDSYFKRPAPVPAMKPVLEPSVPDLSLLINAPSQNSFRRWKNENSLLRKQVRFNSPQCPENPVNDPVSIKKNSSDDDVNKVFNCKQFQEIYMGNIPNRHLDLSLMDLFDKRELPMEQSKPVEEAPKEEVAPKVPKTYKEFLDMQQSIEKTKQDEHCITDIYNYNSPKISRHKNVGLACRRENLQEELLRNKSQEIMRHTNIRKENLKEKLLADKSNSPEIMRHTNIRRENMQEKLLANNSNSPEIMRYSNIKPASGRTQIQEELSDNASKSRLSNENPVTKSNSSVQTSFVHITNSNPDNTAIARKDSEDQLTVKDLLKIIQQQNEQLLILQKQVAHLIESKDNLKKIEAAPSPHSQKSEDKHLELPPTTSGSTPRKGQLSKFSIDLMTSFEVSFKPQCHRKRDFPLEPKICEITEDEYNDTQKKITNLETSFALQEPIRVQENCPSPEPSINIEMKDYESSEDEEKEDESSSSEIGASFYKNLMEQVNKIIEQNGSNDELNNSRIREQTLSQVKDATLRHLKKVGLNFSTIDEVSTPNCSSNGTAMDQVSFVVKQLLMKYLPDDKLAKLTQTNRVTVENDAQEKIVLNSRAPEFSFATIQFMKKYNLISEANQQEVKKPMKTQKRKVLNKNCPKILDITALKQQPKLL